MYNSKNSYSQRYYNNGYNKWNYNNMQNYNHYKEINNYQSKKEINDKVEKEKNSETNNVFDKINEVLKNDNQLEEPLFEIMNIKIYFDDVLIVCILLFLYQEKIEDQFLFIALILLLLS